MQIMKILIIGAGPSSALLASNLKTTFLKGVHDISIWEKSAKIAGRFQTFSSSDSSSCTADLGAQYLTQSHSHLWSNSYFDELVGAGLLKEINTTSLPGFKQDESKVNFVCTKGTGSIVNYYFEKAGCLDKIETHKNVTQISINTSVQNMTDVYNESGQKESFDIVISTIPVPELLKLKDLGQILKDTSELLKVNYSTRFALGIFFHEKISLTKENQPLNFVPSNKSSPIRYWSIENLKRHGGNHATASTECPAIVAHTSVDYGATNFGTGTEAVKNYLVEELKKETGKLMEDSSKYSVICHQWKYSQVFTPYVNSPGLIVINQNPLILGAGDSFSYSGFEGCIHSAENTTRFLKSILK